MMFFSPPTLSSSLRLSPHNSAMDESWNADRELRLPAPFPLRHNILLRHVPVTHKQDPEILKLPRLGQRTLASSSQRMLKVTGSVKPTEPCKSAKSRGAEVPNPDPATSRITQDQRQVAKLEDREGSEKGLGQGQTCCQLV